MDLPEESQEIVRENIQLMRDLSPQKPGMDVIIVVTGDQEQEKYWEKRLQESISSVGKKSALVITTSEDWPVGAGNGLGTLYAYQRAEEKAHKIHGVDLRELQREGAAIGMYHTAGKGTRLAPLSGSECNNKSSVKLPEVIDINGHASPITILEAVIRQTGIYADCRKGRLSVFWGDQIFIPSVKATYSPLHHVDILMRNLPPLSKEEWQKRGLEKYGLIIADEAYDAMQVEKVDYETYKSLRASESTGHTGMSLGSFSLSFAITEALLEEFSSELNRKEGFFNSDQGFWMPLTLTYEIYAEVLQKKDAENDRLRKHFDRMQIFKRKFLSEYPEKKLFGAVELGEDSYVWDYGQLKRYYENILSLTGSNPESQAMRSFYGFPDSPKNSLESLVECDQKSLVVNSCIKNGKIHNSILIGVEAEDIDVSNAVIINTSAKQIEGTNCLVYNVLENGHLSLIEGTARADAFISEAPKHLTFTKNMNQSSDKEWDENLEGNPLSFAELYESNKRTGLSEAIRIFQEEKAKLGQVLKLGKV